MPVMSLMQHSVPLLVRHLLLTEVNCVTAMSLLEVIKMPLTDLA